MSAKLWNYVEYTDSGDHVSVISEDDIIEKFYPYWSGRMIEKFGQEEFEKTYTKQDCIDDWVVVNWAWQ